MGDTDPIAKVHIQFIAEISDSISRFIFLMSQENGKVTILVASCSIITGSKKNRKYFRLMTTNPN